MYPVSYEADAAIEGRNRLTTFFRYLVSIPWQIVAALYGFVAQFAAFFAWFAIVFTGRYPEGLYNFNAGFLRMASRVNAFNYLLTDDWPPFNGEQEEAYPIRIGVAPPLDSYSRLKTFFRLIVGIPVMILAWVQGLILGVVTLIAWFAILFTGKFPEGLFGPVRSASAYLARAGAYFLLLTEDWPPFSLEDGAGTPAGQIPSEAASREVR
ncbi:MAG: DUF4389 domain-containing protein [Solirubrobacterales bacterium]